ncbi:hypothetical protein, partial [[Eubacterium] cellulosolvens]
ISTDSFSLDAGHKTGKFPASGSGWIKVESTQPIVGMLNFDDYRNRMGSMPGITTSSTLYYPHFDQGSSWQTYYAIVNSGPACSITSTYYASNGSTIGSDSISIPENNKAGRFPSSGSGWIELPS